MLLCCAFTLSHTHTHRQTYLHTHTRRGLLHDAFLCSSCICNASELEEPLAATSVCHITVDPPLPPPISSLPCSSFCSSFGHTSSGVFRSFSTTFYTLSLFAGCGCLAFYERAVHMFTCPPVTLFLSLSIYLPLSPSPYLFVCPFVCPTVTMS